MKPIPKYKTGDSVRFLLLPKFGVGKVTSRHWEPAWSWWAYSVRFSLASCYDLHENLLSPVRHELSKEAHSPDDWSKERI